VEALAVEVTDVFRDYSVVTGSLRRRRSVVHALRGVSLTVRPGEIHGLLGPNGAGKTTLVKVLTTLLLPTSGTARVAGHDVVRESRAVRRSIGFVFGGDKGLYERLSVWDNLKYFAELYGLRPAEQAPRIHAVAAQVRVGELLDRRVETLSRGQRQRVHLARGLVHDPAVVFLDEPTVGIDPVGARTVRVLIASLRDAGKAVVIATHSMPEAEELCDRLSMIAGGQIVFAGSPAEMRAWLPARPIVEVWALGLNDEELTGLRSQPEIAEVNVDEIETRQVLTITSAGDPRRTVAALERVIPRGIALSVTVRDPTLEDVYISMVTGGERVNGHGR
jgi:ABC-2 type transport system ATP-binding protein